MVRGSRRHVSSDEPRIRPRCFDCPRSFLLVFCALLLSGSGLRADEFTQNSRYSARLFSGGTLIIDSRVGDIHVSGWDEPRVQIDAEKLVRAGNEKAAQPLFGRINVVLEGQDKEVRLLTSYPARRFWRPFRGESKLTVNFEIEMPYDANLVLHCVDGDVRVAGVNGREQLRVNYGDVEIDVPSVWALRSFYAHAWLGYVQSDLHGTESDAAGMSKKISFWNPNGSQDVAVQVRMGGVFVYSDAQ
ncbi:MAG TPA: hypothetical protein VMT20_00170 [Terriglobia bacterium]|nr:hypothetical protein [Terriglobia bacterium]